MDNNEKTPSGNNSLATFFDTTLALNCFTNTVLFDILYNNAEIVTRFIEHPYWTAFTWLGNGFFWASFGIWLRRFYSDTPQKNVISGVLMNGLFTFCNVLMFLKIRQLKLLN